LSTLAYLLYKIESRQNSPLIQQRVRLAIALMSVPSQHCLVSSVLLEPSLDGMLPGMLYIIFLTISLIIISLTIA
jgi:hypothetical protein